jgi:importin-7
LLTQFMSHAYTWNMLKDNVMVVIKDIVFPLLCFTDEEQELWENEPYEFVHRKFDVLDDFKNPISAAQELLQEAVLVRKKTLLMPILEFCMSILAQYSHQSIMDASLARKKDGALTLIGYVSESLEKQKTLKSQLDDMLVVHVLPELRSVFPFLRARACWTLQTFSFVEFKNAEHFKFALEGVICCLRDSELPVQVHAAMALQDLLTDHEESREYVRPYLATIVEDLLKLTNESDFEEVASVVQEFISEFVEELRPFAVQICTQLRDNLMRLQKEEASAPEEDTQHKAFTAYGVLRAILTLVDALSDSPQLLAEVDVVLAPMIAYVLHNKLIDMYEEIFQVVTMSSYYAKAVHPSLWSLLPVIHEAFKSDAFVYFSGKLDCTCDGDYLF